MSGRGAGRWIIVAYDLPNEPSKLRVRAWRSFKKFGALYPPVSLCLLPNELPVKRGVEQFRSDFKNLGTILMLGACAVDSQDETVLAKMFHEDRRQQYEEVLEECQEFTDEVGENLRSGNVTYEETDELEQTLRALERWYRSVRGRAHGLEEGAPKVEKALTRCRKVLATFEEKAQPLGINK